MTRPPSTCPALPHSTPLSFALLLFQPAGFLSIPRVECVPVTSGVGTWCSLCPRCLTHLLFSHLPSKLLLQLRSAGPLFLQSSLDRLDEVSGDFPSKPYFSFQLSSQCVFVNLCDYLMNISFLHWAVNFPMSGMVSALFMVLPPPHSTDSSCSVKVG